MVKETRTKRALTDAREAGVATARRLDLLFSRRSMKVGEQRMGHSTQKKTDPHTARVGGQLENMFSVHVLLGKEETEKLGCKRMFHSSPCCRIPGSHFPNY